MTWLLAYIKVPLIQRGLTAMLGVLLALGVSEYWLWAPARAEYTQARQTLVALQGEATTLKARVDETKHYEARVALLKDAEARLKANVDRAGVVARIADISAASGTRIIHGANSFGKPRAGVTPVLQDLTVEGPYSAVSKFIDELATFKTLTLIRKAEFSANPDGSLVRVKLQLMTLSAGGGK